MVSRFTTLVFLLISILLVIIIQEISAIENHEYLLKTWKINPIKDDLFNENKMFEPHHQVTTILQRTKRQSGYNYRNRRYPYPIPILVGGGFGPRGFGTRGFGSRGFGAKGFGARGFGARGFGGRGIGGLGRGIGGFGGRGRG